MLMDVVVPDNVVNHVLVAARLAALETAAEVAADLLANILGVSLVIVTNRLSFCDGRLFRRI